MSSFRATPAAGTRRPDTRRERELQAVIDAVPDGVLMVDTHGTVLSANPAAERIFLCPAGQAFGQPLATFLQAAAGADTVDSVGLRSDGSRFPAQVSFSAVGDGHKIAVVRDLTERVRADAERMALAEQFIRAQKMETVGALAEWVAHDVGNILNAMLACAEYVRDDLPADDPRALMLDSSVRAGLRGQDIVTQLLAYSRGMAGNGPVSVGDIVRDASALLQCFEDRGLSVGLDIGTDTPAIRGCGTQLYQAVVNLLVNAVQASPSHGAVLEVAVGPFRLAEPWVGGGPPVRDGEDWRLRVGSVPPGAYVSVTVRDFGTGISPDVLARIFDPFFTTKAAGQGTGLGLSAVSGIVCGHGGAITVQSRPGQGASFQLLLPLGG